MSEHVIETEMSHGALFIPYQSKLAEAVREEITRCRDCAKWHHVDTEDGVRFGECDEWRRPDSCCVPATREDGFCCWAKPKKEDA